MNQIDLSIVIPVFNNVNFTKACLNDLIKLPGNHEVLIIDNGSTDDTELVCKQFQQMSLDARTNGGDKITVRYYKNAKNLGFAKACNIGYKEAVGTNVMFLNNDIRVKDRHSDWTAEIIKLSKDFIVGPTGGIVDGNANFIRETDKIVVGNYYMSGWCLSASRELWEKLIIKDYVGPFSEEFGIAYFEDTDMGLRATELGLPFKIQPVPVHHFGQMTSKKVGISKLYPIAQMIFRNKWGSKLKT